MVANLPFVDLLQFWKQSKKSFGFPGGPVPKTPCFQCRGPGFDPWSGNWIPHAATKGPHATTKI